MSRSLTELRHRHVIEGRPLDTATERALRSDPRAGAWAILHAVERRRFEARSEGQRLRKMLRYELALWSAGIMTVAGVDEAGMSPLAGPVAAGAVVFRPDTRITGVDDSKSSTPRHGSGSPTRYGARRLPGPFGFVEVEEIDRINIYHASLLAMRRAVEGLSCAPQHLLIDGRCIKQLQTPQQAIIGGDGKCFAIAAASIIAKTARDALMQRLDAEHPGYGFAKHKGYPVLDHLTALKRLGACPIHRRSFGPVRTVMGLPPLPPWPQASA